MNEWTRCRHWIEGALKYTGGTHTIEDIEEGIALGKFQFWAGQKAAIVTEIISYPRLRALNYWLIGGDLPELEEMESRITPWGFAHGCSKVMGVGRKGLERVFSKHGYRLQWVCISKDLST